MITTQCGGVAVETGPGMMGAGTRDSWPPMANEGSHCVPRLPAHTRGVFKSSCSPQFTRPLWTPSIFNSISTFIKMFKLWNTSSMHQNTETILGAQGWLCVTAESTGSRADPPAFSPSSASHQRVTCDVGSTPASSSDTGTAIANLSGCCEVKCIHSHNALEQCPARSRRRRVRFYDF